MTPLALHVLPHRGGGGEAYVDLMERITGFEHERVPLSSGRTPASAAVSLPLRWPAVAARARRASLVHAHGDMAAILALPLLRGRPSVWSTHGLHFLRRARGTRLGFARRGLRAAVAAAECTICTSEAERTELAEIAAPEHAGRLVLIYNGLEPSPVAGPEERAAARAGLGLAEDEVAVLYLGRLEERKDPLTAVAAAEAADGPVVLLLAGDGPLLSGAERRAGASVRVLGHRDDGPALLAASDVFVMPSEREGLSYAVLEAMAAGLAMVVSDGPGNPEAVGDAGVVVPFGDERALAAALSRLAGDPAERERLGAAGRARVLDRFTAEQMVRETAAVYEAVGAGDRG
ncbi:MAG: glycosyltransferase family 4 protein [Thermoleophilaceae bacterium]